MGQPDPGKGEGLMGRLSLCPPPACSSRCLSFTPTELDFLCLTLQYFNLLSSGPGLLSLPQLEQFIYLMRFWICRILHSKLPPIRTKFHLYSPFTWKVEMQPWTQFQPIGSFQLLNLKASSGQFSPGRTKIKSF